MSKLTWILSVLKAAYIYNTLVTTYNSSSKHTVNIDNINYEFKLDNAGFLSACLKLYTNEDINIVQSLLNSNNMQNILFSKGFDKIPLIQGKTLKDIENLSKILPWDIIISTNDRLTEYYAEVLGGMSTVGGWYFITNEDSTAYMTYKWTKEDANENKGNISDTNKPLPSVWNLNKKYLYIYRNKELSIDNSAVSAVTSLTDKKVEEDLKLLQLAETALQVDQSRVFDNYKTLIINALGYSLNGSSSSDNLLFGFKSSDPVLVISKRIADLLADDFNVDDHIISALDNYANDPRLSEIILNIQNDAADGSISALQAKLLSYIISGSATGLSYIQQPVNTQENMFSNAIRSSNNIRLQMPLAYSMQSFNPYSLGLYLYKFKDGNTVYTTLEDASTYYGEGGNLNIFEMIDNNKLNLTYMQENDVIKRMAKNDLQHSEIHTRIYSTNDASIILDEFSVNFTEMEDSSL